MANKEMGDQNKCFQVWSWRVLWLPPEILT